MALVVAHGDLDGVVSAALVKRVEELRGYEVRIVFTGYGRHVRVWRDAERLWVLDLGLDPWMLDHVAREASGVEFKAYVDHHIQTLRAVEELNGLFDLVLVDPSRCTARIIAEDVYPRLGLRVPPKVELMLPAIDAVDRGVRSPNGRMGDFVVKLSKAIAVGGQDLKYRLLDHLTSMAPPDQGLVREVEELSRKADELVSSLVGRALSSVVVEDDNYMVVELPSCSISGTVAKKLYRETGKVVVVKTRGTGKVLYVVAGPGKTYQLVLRTVQALVPGATGGGHPGRGVIVVGVEDEERADRVILEALHILPYRPRRRHVAVSRAPAH